jgi:LPS-assembly protein
LIRYSLSIILTLFIFVDVFAENVIIEAQKIQKISDVEVLAQVNVEIKYKDITVKSSEIIYNLKEEKITYNVPTEVFSPKFYIKSDKGFYFIKKQSGEFYNVSAILENKYFIKAKEISKNQDIIYFKDAKFSNCPFNQYDWFVYSTSGSVKKDDKMKAKNVIFNFCKIPVFYTPYFTYPTSSRKTGFLPVSISQDTYNKLILKVPFFYVINESSDTTITVDYRDKQGEGLNVEYRKVFSKNANIDINTFYFKENKNGTWWQGRTSKILTQRWLLQADGKVDSLKNTKIFINLNIPSDPYFYEDFYNTSPLRYTSYTKSRILALTDTQDFSFETNFDYIYDLTTPTNENSLQRLPEIRFYWKERPLFKNLYYDFLSVNTNFYREAGVRGLRSDNTLRILMPTTYKYITNLAEISPRFTYYYLNNTDTNKSPSRNLLTFKDRVATVFYKNYDSFYHNIVPSVEFTYVSKVNQETLPYFDKEDRVNAQKDLDLYLTNILGFKNDNFFRWTLSTGYTFLDSYYIGDNIYEGHEKPLTNSLYFSINGFSGENTLYYDFQKNQISRTISSLTIPVYKNISYSISHSYDKDSTNQLLQSVSASYKIFTLTASILNNLKQGYVQQKRLNLTINRGCWYLSFNYIEDYNIDTNKTYKVLTLTLNIVNLNYNFPLIKPTQQ